MQKIHLFDTTLRDGAQSEGVSFTVEDKLRIVKLLDEFGIDYVEGGNPGSNPKDVEFFRRVSEIPLRNSKLVAFGSTCRPGTEPGGDPGVAALLGANTPCCAVFGKCWDFHVTTILRTSPEENLRMIEKTIRYLVKQGKEVVFDGEHFFDGYRYNPEYALAALRAAEAGGASWLVLCDTNGGTFLTDIEKITQKMVETLKTPIGIHCHNDCGMAIGSSLLAVRAGAAMVQGTIDGFGERCGNADLIPIIAGLHFKMGLSCVAEESLPQLYHLAREVSNVANITFNERSPYVGNSAFAHKGGMHVDGILKNPTTFEHLSPDAVGNSRRFLLSEVGGRSGLVAKLHQIEPRLRKDSPETQQIMDALKQKEFEGYQFEGAEASFELMVIKCLGRYKPAFSILDFTVFCERPEGENSAKAVIKVMVGGKERLSAAEGDGPVNAMDLAVRDALSVFFPSLQAMHLTDYKVRVLNSEGATAARVRVQIASTDGKRTWRTVGVSTNILEASWIALIDSLEYKLMLENK